MPALLRRCSSKSLVDKCKRTSNASELDSLESEAFDDGRSRRKGAGYKRDSQFSLLSDADDGNKDMGLSEKDLQRDEKKKASVTLPQEEVRRSYRKMCNIEGVSPCGRFARQIDDTVADVSHSMLGPRDVKCICVALSTNVTIKDLDLSGNDLSGKGALYLSEALRENTSIDEVTLEECNIDHPGLQALCGVLLDMKPLKSIDLSKNKFGTRQADLIAEVIKKNDYIENLVLSGNEIDNVGGTSIGKALGSNVGLRRLDLSWNHIRLEAASVICSALKLNSTLEELDLSWNGLSEDGCRALGRALPHNHTLQRLDLSSNRISPFALNALVPGLLKNDTLKELRMCMNPLTTVGAIAMLQCFEKAKDTQMKELYLMDIPVNHEFLDALENLKKVRPMKVHHREPNRKKITQIVKDRTLKDYDPAMILFEYMKQENMRLIDLFRTFDTDSSQTVTKDELREGFVTINMPLSDEALESLFERMDLDGSNTIEYDEVKVGYRSTMGKMRCSSRSQAQTRTEEDKTFFLKQLKKLVHKALGDKRKLFEVNAKRRSSDALKERREEKLLELRGKRRQRQISIIAVFEKTLAAEDLKKKILERLEEEK
ncbi:leucine-rich repeat-containing protein 74B-like [Mya arenaria]|uniref:leucine-rich repeat-containing protein 74B-like n=1 Tax=Mya arenaria TaxID=6604 RepID=UPI0022E750BB|nr:leucine-rich repeat-containing protein 74B-like [Mya arenaria]